jgi:hypothetical protein
MSPTMIRTAAHGLLGAAWLVACGGQGKALLPQGELGNAQHDTRSAGAAPAAPGKPDPSRAFRLGYANPGGMWLPDQMLLPQHAETFQGMGVALDPKQLANPLGEPLAAVVNVDGCTGSFVSGDGLIVTNHHCVESALQYVSDEKHDRVAGGFLAKTLADEPNIGPSARISALQGYKDVTHEMTDGLAAIKDPIVRKDEAERRSKQLVAACENERPGIRCRVSGLFGGGMFQLFEMLEIRDVRLVYAPERSIGDFGGEVDNWNWPRETGDWTFYRAYVGKDGVPADYSKDNVPYRPKHWLRTSAAPLRAGDFVMVAGYAGDTDRLAPASETRHDLEWGLPYGIAFAKERYALADSFKDDPDQERRIKVAVMKEAEQNGLAKYEAVLQGFQNDPQLLARKEASDRKAKEWAAQPGRETYKDGIDKLEHLLQERRQTARVDFDRAQAFHGSSLLATSLGLLRRAEERQKKDAERKPGYQERDLARAVASQKGFLKHYDRVLDRAGFRLALVRAAQLPESDRPWLATLLAAKKGQTIDQPFIDKTLDAWYKAPLIEDEKLRLELVQKGTVQQLQGSKDPFVQAALRVWPIIKEKQKRDDAMAGELLLVRPLYVEALKQALGGALAPDANGSLRITYGTIRSLHPESKDPADWPFTVATQILGKDTGKEPFDSPTKLLDAIRAKHYGAFADPELGGDLAVDFLSDVDITGGNSGSPTLNGKGELVGLVFDSNKEGVTSDIVFNGATTRAIHVGTRYMVWVMHVIDDADRLLHEMCIDPTPLGR